MSVEQFNKYISKGIKNPLSKKINKDLYAAKDYKFTGVNLKKKIEKNVKPKNDIKLSPDTVKLFTTLTRANKNLMPMATTLLVDNDVKRIFYHKLIENPNRGEDYDNKLLFNLERLEKKIEKEKEGHNIAGYTGILKKEIEFPKLTIQDLNPDTLTETEMRPQITGEKNFYEQFQKIFSKPNL